MSITEAESALSAAEQPEGSAGGMGRDAMRRLIRNPAAIAGASGEDLGRILTTLVRGDRFSEGTLANAYETGVLRAIVRRASVLATELGVP